MPPKVKKIVKKVVKKKTKVVKRKSATEPATTADTITSQQNKKPRIEPALPKQKKEEFSESESSERNQDKHTDTDSDSDSGVDLAAMMGGNKNVLGSFIEKRTGNYVEAEVVEATGKVRDAIVMTLAEAERPVIKQSTPFEPENNYLNFKPNTESQQQGSGGTAENLDLSTTMPTWLPGSTRDLCGTSVFENPAVMMHYEIAQFLKYTSLSKADRSIRKKLGKTALDLIKKTYGTASGVLVGSMATRLADKMSTVDIGVSGCGGKNEIEKIFDAEEGWEVVKELRGDPGLVKLRSKDISVNLLLNESGEEAAATADFLTQTEAVYGDKLQALISPIKEMLRQRRANGTITPHILTLLAICFLNARRAGRVSTDTTNFIDNFGSLLVDFLLFLCHRFNSFICVLNPSDPTGRVIKKSASTAPGHYLHIIDPITKKNCAVPTYNWALVRETLETAVNMLSISPQCPVPVPGTHHAAHPDVTKRPTPLSRLINCEKML